MVRQGVILWNALKDGLEEEERRREKEEGTLRESKKGDEWFTKKKEYSFDSKKMKEKASVKGIILLLYLPLVYVKINALYYIYACL